MSCMRHSYPKGSKAGDGRSCRNCGIVDGLTREIIAPTPTALVSTPKDVAEACSGSVSTLSANLPAHSPLGASGAHRWMPCPGSVTFDELLRLDPEFEDDDPDYRRDGVQAHALGAHCLETDRDCWEADATQFPELTGEMIDAVQVYLDHCRSLPSRIVKIEHRMHRPEFHRLAFGTADFVSVHILDAVLDIVDYKHGVGVVVEVESNVQLMYYGYLFIGEDHDEYPDEMTVRFHIVQPRAEHSAGPIRIWEMRAGELRKWVHETLIAAMERTADAEYLDAGEWCRFCPAKLVCPVHIMLQQALVRVQQKGVDVKFVTDEYLGELNRKWQLAKMLGADIDKETEKRVLNGRTIPNVKAVNKKAYMVWKDAAPIEAKFGIAGFDPKTPAQIRELTGGKEFEAEWAFNANNGKLAVAPVTDARKRVEIKTADQKFGDAVKQLEAAE